ncbi:MAG: RNA methyltransferase, partial [Bifidobacterium crudilactis]|nr:RNA methyltransferase [Bifidobacterium crudilactis]
MYGKAESMNLATSAAILLHTVAMSSHFERI